MLTFLSSFLNSFTEHAFAIQELDKKILNQLIIFTYPYNKQNNI